MTIIAFNRPWVIRWHWLLVNLVAVAILLSLSVWQWQRAAHKQKNLTRIAQWQTQPAIPLIELITHQQRNHDTPINDGRAISFTGRWISPFVWLLDNQIVKGRQGYDVLVPVRQSDSPHSPIVIVNLGWVAAPATRSELPEIGITDELIVQGIYRARAGGLLLGENLEDKGTWPMRAQKIDTQAFATYLSGEIISGVIYQQGYSPFITHYNPVVLPPERHRAYALQWLLLAIAAIVVGVACAMSNGITIIERMQGGAE
jgi:cytochrome oxidase assembly protein ShyY1